MLNFYKSCWNSSEKLKEISILFLVTFLCGLGLANWGILFAIFVIGLSISILILVALYRAPIWSVYFYLIVAPFDQFSVVKGFINLSLADIVLVYLLLICLLRPKILLLPPMWFTSCVIGILLSGVMATVFSFSYEVLSVLRGMVGKIVAAYLITAIIIKFGHIKKAIFVFCLGIICSVMLGLFQEFIYLKEGWLVLLNFVGPDAIVAPNRFFNVIPLRVPGGTGHPAFLGELIIFPIAVGLGNFLTNKDNRLLNTALVGGGIVGIFITMTRATLLGVTIALVLVLFHQLVKRFTLIRPIVIVGIVLLFIISIIFFIDITMENRLKVIQEMINIGSKIFIGMGPGMFGQINSLNLGVHSTPLQLLTDFGALGALSYIMIVCIISFLLWRRAKFSNISLVMLSGFLGYMAASSLFHPNAGVREHWIILSLGAAASQLRFSKINTNELISSISPSLTIF